MQDRPPRRSALAEPGVLLLAQLAVRLTGPAISLLVIRYLGPDLFGQYASALAVTTLLAALTDFGLNHATLQLAANPRRKLGAVIQTALGLAALYVLLAGVVLAFWITVARYTDTIVIIALLQSMGFLRAPIVSLLTAGLQVRGKYARIGGWLVVIFCAQWFATLVAMWVGTSVYVLVGGPLSLSCLAAALMAMIEGRSLGVWTRYSPSERVPTRELFSSSLGLGTSASMHHAYHHSDAALLSALRPHLEVGHYTASFRLVDLVNTLPTIVFNQVLYPKYFRWRATNRDRLHAYHRMTAAAMTAIGLAAGAALALFAGDLAEMLFSGPQEQVASLLIILAWAIPLRFLASASGAILTTDGHISVKLRIQGLVATGNVLLNLALIPRYGAVASAALVVSTDLSLAIAYGLAARRRAQFRVLRSGTELPLTALLAAMVVGVSISLGGLPPLLRLLTLGGMSAGLALFTWGSLGLSERQEIRMLLNGRLG